MNRRSAIRSVLFITAGTTLLPACMQDKATIPLTNLSLTARQEKMMAGLTAAIIPTNGDFIGAADLKAHEFVLMMIDECEAPEDQQKFMDGLTQFEKLVNTKYDKEFEKLSPAQQSELLTSLQNKKDITENVQLFYQATKMYTIQAFASSEKFMTNIRKYKMVPGSNFKGCVPVG